MGSELQFTIDGHAIAQPRQRFAVHRGKVRCYIDKAHPIHAWKQLVKMFARQHKPKDWLLGEPVQLSILFVLPRLTEKYHLFFADKPKERFPAHQPAFCVADIDNLAKAVMDALNGVLWEDDSQVWGLWTQKLYAADGERPRVVVRVLTGIEDGELQ